MCWGSHATPACKPLLKWPQHKSPVFVAPTGLQGLSAGSGAMGQGPGAVGMQRWLLGGASHAAWVQEFPPSPGRTRDPNHMCRNLCLDLSVADPPPPPGHWHPDAHPPACPPLQASCLANRLLGFAFCVSRNSEFDILGKHWLYPGETVTNVTKPQKPPTKSRGRHQLTTCHTDPVHVHAHHYHHYPPPPPVLTSPAP